MIPGKRLLISGSAGHVDSFDVQFSNSRRLVMAASRRSDCGLPFPRPRPQASGRRIRRWQNATYLLGFL
jgi:hypothetical protein